MCGQRITVSKERPDKEWLKRGIHTDKLKQGGKFRLGTVD